MRGPIGAFIRSYLIAMSLTPGTMASFRFLFVCVVIGARSCVDFITTPFATRTLVPALGR
jgi:hypothetical protein